MPAVGIPQLDAVLHVGDIVQVGVRHSRNNGKVRTKGFRDGMKENGDIKEVALDQMQHYTADETFKYVQDMLTAHPDLHGIFVQTDTPTLGAVRAIQAAHRQVSVLLAAFDGVPEFIDLIRQGKIVASGMVQPFQMGVESAKAMSIISTARSRERRFLSRSSSSQRRTLTRCCRRSSEPSSPTS
jgi:ribose transport system substrate-binding protein